MSKMPLVPVPVSQVGAGLWQPPRSLPEMHFILFIFIFARNAVFLQSWQEKVLTACTELLEGEEGKERGVTSQFCLSAFYLPYLNLLEEEIFTKIMLSSLPPFRHYIAVVVFLLLKMSS